ncbi:hypothetical protein PVIIG_05767 [Plasmodium vivax India VII]|uniref:PIR Superfamily Protein n=1 Tax=Plasmodium vivax India VII TaxID=1077284 RepID=A0A0J9S5S1_PLAVI|nr:hypothetical protein PVIIG_05767 [Plasmodium vivax India VII]
MNNEHKDLQNYHHKCKDIIVNQKGRENMILICKKYLRFLDKSKSWRNVDTGYNISLLLNYWLYEKLIGIYGPNNDELIRQGFSALQQKWDTFDSSIIHESYYEKCKPNLKMVNNTDWDKRKELYDYCVDYGYFSIMAKILQKRARRIVQHKSHNLEPIEVVWGCKELQ